MGINSKENLEKPLTSGNGCDNILPNGNDLQIFLLHMLPSGNSWGKQKAPAGSRGEKMAKLCLNPRCYCIQWYGEPTYAPIDWQACACMAFIMPYVNAQKGVRLPTNRFTLQWRISVPQRNSAPQIPITRATRRHLSHGNAAPSYCFWRKTIQNFNVLFCTDQRYRFVNVIFHLARTADKTTVF